MAPVALAHELAAPAYNMARRNWAEESPSHNSIAAEENEIVGHDPIAVMAVVVLIAAHP
jgi:hypothetical protein